MIQKEYMSELSDAQKKSLNALIADCIQYEKLELSPPDLSDGDACAYIYYDSSRAKKPDSVLIAYDMGDYLEITAFTAPDKRCRGFFSSLFERFMSEHSEASICIYTDGDSYDAFMTLTVYECEYAGTEHLMKLDAPISFEIQEGFYLESAVESDIDALAEIHSSCFELDKAASFDFLKDALDSGENIWKISSDGRLVGLVITSDQGSETCLYGLAIKPDEQGKGFGYAAAAAICSSSFTFPITLHVTEENSAAYRIYKKLGFKTEQELMEYWY